MFPLQRSCELSFQLSADKDGGHHSDHNPHQPYLFISSDSPHTKVMGSASESRNPIMGDDTASGELGNSGRRRRRSSSNHGAGAADYGDSKRIIHRETERQRRLEMTSHFTTLRNLLPDNYVKGRRAMSDHIMEAANYIKDLQKRTKEMERKRDKLKGKDQDPLRAMNIRGSSARESDGDVVSVERCSLDRLEIKISCGLDEDVPLSRLLGVVMQQGLDVVSYVSTKVRRRFIHVIHAEMKDISSIDPSWLQGRLMNEVCSYDN